VATTSRSSSGPTTSWIAMTRSAKVMGWREGLAAPGLPRRTGVPALRAITVAMSCPPTMSLHCCTRRGITSVPVACVPRQMCGMVGSPEAAIGLSGCVVLTWGKIGCMR